jgi:hypothetical protein
MPSNIALEKRRELDRSAALAAPSPGQKSSARNIVNFVPNCAPKRTQNISGTPLSRHKLHPETQPEAHPIVSRGACLEHRFCRIAIIRAATVAA